MRKIYLISVLIFFTTSIFAQTKKEWFPAGLNIQPFTANLLEARDGASYLLNQKKLSLDIGTSADIYRINYGNSVLSFGGDLFTFTRLRSENDFRFPVETIDYFFGVNSGYKIIDGIRQYGFRFRLSHISAHLVDGRYNASSNTWLANLKPFIYSREFVELFPFYKINSFRVYAGLTYLFHVIPKNIGRGIYQVGFDYYLPSFISKKISPFIADDFKLSSINKYFGNNIICAGIKFGKYDSRGFSIRLSYYSGKSIHGELFLLTENYATVGISLDL